MSARASYHEPTTLTPAKVLRGGVLTRLGHLNQWVAWKWGSPRENGKQPKVPIDPTTGGKASVTDSGTWTDFEAARMHEGVGFVLTREDELTAFDLDDCICAGEVKPWATEIVEALDSYTELSPSGTGLHVWVKGTLPVDGFNKKKQGVEGYSARHFMTWTGERFYGDDIEERQDELTALYYRLHPAPLESVPQAVRSESGGADGNLPDDYDLLEKARTTGADPATFARLYDSGYREGENRSVKDNQFMSFLAFWTGKDAERMERLFSSSALGQRGKWKNRKDYRQRTVANAIARTGKVYDPKHKPQQTTREKLNQRMGYALFVHKWNTGRASAAATDYSCYRVLLEKAFKANTVAVDVSERELAEKAGLGRRAARDSLWRLEDKHGWLVKVGNGGKDGAATYRLKPVDSKGDQILISTNCLSNGFTTTTTVSIRRMWSLLSQTLDLRNPAPDMPDYDKNGRRIPKGKQDPLNSLVKVCGWILDMVHASQTALPLSFLSERTGIRPNNLKKRYIIPMTVAGFIKETEDGYVATTNVEEALRDELEDSGCNERAKLQRERHDRERDAYSKRKNEKPDRAPTEEEMDAIREQRDSEDSDFEDFDGIELKPLLTPLAIACREYLERNPSRRNETPSWLAGTLWAYELYPGKPTRYEVAVALEELVGNRSLIKFA